MTNEEAISIIENRDNIMDYCESQQLAEALEMAIAALKVEPCEDCVSREAVLDALHVEGRPTKRFDYVIDVKSDIMALPPVTPKQRWIPVKWHEITEEEREKEGYPNEWLVYLDCILPEDGEEILITTKRGLVEKDTAYCDDGYYLDSCYDWVNDVVAWMPLPEPYKAESEGK